MGRKFGWHSGKLICKDLDVQNTISLGTLDFGAAELDSILLKGRLSTSTLAGAALSLGTEYTYPELVELRTTVTDWTGIAGSFKGYYFRAETTSGNASYGIRGMEIFGVANITSGTTGIGSVQGLYVEECLKHSTASWTLGGACAAIEANISIYAGSGTLTVTNDNSCLKARLQGAGGVADYTKFNGITIECRDGDSSTRVFGDAIAIQDPSDAYASDWTNGMVISAGCTTGIAVSATTTTGVYLSGTTTNALYISGGTIGTGVRIGATTSGIVIAGTTTTGLSISGNSTTPISINSSAGTITGEVHGLEVAFTGTLSSGDAIIGGNFAVTTAGTAGMWASGIYAKVVQGATKNVSGYLCAAEFELQNTAALSSDNAVLVLTSSSAVTGGITCVPYIMLREYGGVTTPGDALVRIFGDAGQTGTTNANILWSTVTSAKTNTHTIRIMVGSTPYYIMCSNSGG